MLRETLFCTEFSVVSWFLQLVPWCSLHSALKKATVPRSTKDMSPMKTNCLLCGLILLAIKSFSFLNESHKPTHRGTNAQNNEKEGFISLFETKAIFFAMEASLIT